MTLVEESPTATRSKLRGPEHRPALDKSQDKEGGRSYRPSFALDHVADRDDEGYVNRPARPATHGRATRRGAQETHNQPVTPPTQHYKSQGWQSDHVPIVVVLLHPGSPSPRPAARARAMVKAPAAAPRPWPPRRHLHESSSCALWIYFFYNQDHRSPTHWTPSTTRRRAVFCGRCSSVWRTFFLNVRCRPCRRRRRCGAAG